MKDPRLRYRSEAMDQLLLEMSEDEHAAERPLLSAVVVRSAPEWPMPCPGFFRVAKQLGSMTEGTTDLDYWRAERRRVFLFPWS